MWIVSECYLGIAGRFLMALSSRRAKSSRWRGFSPTSGGETGAQVALSPGPLLPSSSRRDIESTSKILWAGMTIAKFGG